MTRNADALPLSVRLCTTIEGALVVPLPGIAYSRPSGHAGLAALQQASRRLLAVRLLAVGDDRAVVLNRNQHFLVRVVHRDAERPVRRVEQTDRRDVAVPAVGEHRQL